MQLGKMHAGFVIVYEQVSPGHAGYLFVTVEGRALMPFAIEQATLYTDPTAAEKAMMKAAASLNYRHGKIVEVWYETRLTREGPAKPPTRVNSQALYELLEKQRAKSVGTVISQWSSSSKAVSEYQIPANTDYDNS